MLLGYVFHTVLPLPLEHHALRCTIQPCVCIYSSASNCCTILLHLHTPFQLPMTPVALQSPHPTITRTEHPHSCSLRSLGDSVFEVYVQKRFADKAAQISTVLK